MKLTRRIAFSFLLAFFIAACSSGSNEDQPENLADGSIVFASTTYGDDHLCSRGFDLGWIDYAAAAQAPVLEPDLSASVLGETGATALILDIFSPEETFCGGEPSADIQAQLDKIDQLGDDAEARRLLEEMLRQFQEQSGLQPIMHVLASPISQLGREDTRRIVRDFLVTAALAQKHGLDDLANEALDSALNTFSEWAETALESTTDIREALIITAEAQLLGLQDLGEDAIEKVKELVDKKLEATLNGFDPCDTTEAKIKELLSHTALAMAVGIQGGNVSTAMSNFETARENLSAKAKGEILAECSGDAFNFVETFSDGIWTISGEAFTCDGTNWHIDIEISGGLPRLVISTTGSLDFTVVDGTSGPQVIPTAGTAVHPEYTGKLIDPLAFELTVREDGSVFVVIGTTGAGTLTFPSPLGILPFISFPGGGFTAYLEPANCTE